MTREQIIHMATEAGLNISLWDKISKDEEMGYEVSGIFLDFERFATLVAEHERKRIAQKIEQLPFGDTSASFAIYVREA